jgi:hypothetical protein
MDCVQVGLRVIMQIAGPFLSIGPNCTMRQKAARVCLAIAVIWFILGGFVLGNAPEWFVISAAFAALAAFLGVRWVRLSGVVLVVASIAASIGRYQAERIMREKVREIQQKAAEKKTSNIELYFCT